ncbi:MAG: hypothetical protein C4344_05660, partial [Acidimicrobiia bacterium]
MRRRPLVSAAVALGVFGLLWWQVATGGPVVRADRVIARWVDTHATGTQLTVARAVTVLGGGAVLYP